MSSRNWPTPARYAWISATWILAALLLLLALFSIHQLVLPLVAFVIPALETPFFGWGVYGTYPTQQYTSFALEGPRAQHLRWNAQCDQGLVLMTPNGPSVERPGPMILDAQGELVWMSDDFGPTANLKMQHYNGENYLTFWSGEKAATSGKGVYFMMDSTYQVVRMISAIGENLFGDLHEFKITEEGTALLTIYNTTSADLRGMGLGRGEDGWIVDNLFQEIDLATGELLFQWKASDHFDPNDTYMTNPFGGHWESAPFDWYHINSVEKDSDGNYLISSRHFHHVVCVSPTGEILWILGGRDNQFTDFSDGQATNFKWQHDARWLSREDGIITLFDNQKAGPLHVDAPNSRALFIKVDVPNRTATLVQSLVSLQGVLASSQGSVQTLPDGKGTFVGWGSAAAYSEYSADGELLCETHLAASSFFWFERMKSYRAIKAFGWHAHPRDPPEVKIEDDSLYVSWNGATEVAFWSLEMSREEVVEGGGDLRRVDGGGEFTSHSDFDSIDIIPKTGFECNFELPSLSAAEKGGARYRVVALDSAHEILGYSDVVTYADATYQSSTLYLLFKIFLGVGIFAGGRMIYQYYLSRPARTFARSRGYSNAILSPPAWMEWKPPSPWKQSDRSRVYGWLRGKWNNASFRP